MNQGPNLMNLRYVAELLNYCRLNWKFKIKEWFKSVIQIWTGGKQLKFIKFCPRIALLPSIVQHLYFFDKFGYLTFQNFNTWDNFINKGTKSCKSDPNMRLVIFSKLHTKLNRLETNVWFENVSAWKMTQRKFHLEMLILTLKYSVQHQ